MKRCTKCGIEKPEEAFEMQPSVGRRRTVCRECRKVSNKAWLEKRKLSQPQQKAETKQCNRCHEVKPISEFSPNGAGYFYAYCKSCKNRQNSVKKEEKRINEGRTWYQPFINKQGILVRGCSRCRIIKPVSEFYSSPRRIHSRCKECDREVQKEHHAANPEKHRASDRKYARKYPERVRANQQRWNALHKEYCAQHRREYRATSHEKLLAHDRMRYSKEERKQSLRESSHRRYQRDPHPRLESWHRYRARQLNAPIVEKIDRKAVIERDNWTCYLCGVTCTPQNVTLDHVVPLYRDGTHTADNLRVACRPCNCKKGTKLLCEMLIGA